MTPNEARKVKLAFGARESLEAQRVLAMEQELVIKLKRATTSAWLVRSYSQFIADLEETEIDSILHPEESRVYRGTVR